jgi:tripartite-type tricarboxylate transporter receptor subunit TctC
MNDLLSGQIDFAVMAVPAVQAHVKAGTLRAVATTGATRVASLPNVATLQEQGYNAVVGGWLAAVGPAKLPAAEVKRIQESILNAWATPEITKAMADQENVLTPMTSDATANFMAREQARFGDIVRRIGVTLD